MGSSGATGYSFWPRGERRRRSYCPSVARAPSSAATWLLEPRKDAAQTCSQGCCLVRCLSLAAGARARRRARRSRARPRPAPRISGGARRRRRAPGRSPASALSISARPARALSRNMKANLRILPGSAPKVAASTAVSSSRRRAARPRRARWRARSSPPGAPAPPAWRGSRPCPPPCSAPGPRCRRWPSSQSPRPCTARGRRGSGAWPRSRPSPASARPSARNRNAGAASAPAPRCRCRRRPPARPRFPAVRARPAG